MNPLTSSQAWKDLAAHHRTLASVRVMDLFHNDPARFKNLSIETGGILLDYSKNLVTGETIRLLLSLAEGRGLQKSRDDMFSGVRINTTENRAALHTALRGGDIKPEVKEALGRLRVFSDAVRSGDWKGYTGKPVVDVVNIGIGGSSLGPQIVTEALSFYRHPRLKMHFVSNVEASDLDNTLKGLSPETTLFIVASKTFTTAETMQNAQAARAWFLNKAGKADIGKHFVAVSGNIEAARTFGIDAPHIFPCWDWVSGRYSVWSAIGLSVMLAVGADHFDSFLSGARAMDDHFRAAPLEQNIPVLLGLIGLWHRNFCHYPAYAVAPYHSGLRRFPAWLQQLDMESNGKSVGRNGEAVECATGPVVFGEPGTDAQHGFFQWLHQGTSVTPVEFIAVIRTPYGARQQQDMLLANCLAQGEALMTGQQNTAEPHLHFSGNKPSTTILLDELSPHTLGMLLALYEHKIFVQGAVWGINSFDQWGVELGKKLATRLQNDLARSAVGTHDSSTAGLLAHIQKTL